MTLIEELKEYLKVKNYTLSRVAKAVNLSNATLHLWMNNNYKGNVKKWLVVMIKPLITYTNHFFLV